MDSEPHTSDEGLPTLRRLGKLWRFSRTDVKVRP
jgi:hypothetical protein